MNNQVGEDNFWTGVRILTLFTEATWILDASIRFLIFIEATKRENKHFPYIIKQFLLMVLSSFDVSSLTLRTWDAVAYLPAAGTLHQWKEAFVLLWFGAKLCPVEVYG